MKRIHIALSTNDIDGTIKDYTKRLGHEPCVVIADEYALWRTDLVNLSVRKDAACKPGALRHLGWEDSQVTAFTQDTDSNGIVWENFAGKHQAEEINTIWPGTHYQVKD